MKTTILRTTTTKNRTEPKFKCAFGIAGQFLTWVSMTRPPWRHGFVLIALILACFALSPSARAADGGLPNQNTAEGTGALSSLTSGANNTAVGFDALFSLTDGSQDTATGSLALANDTGGNNTAFGFSALNANTTGQFNTATGRNALLSNTTGISNTATGSAALFSNTIGIFNTATGRAALGSNTEGSDNAAFGFSALDSNTTGNSNTANGSQALLSNTEGDGNTASGFQSLYSNTSGGYNTATGWGALYSNTEGVVNTANGVNALFTNTTGSQNSANGNSALINGNGQLGTARFKDAIKPMDRASEAILALKPVTFRYKKEIDADRTPQFGLIAEDVEKVNPNLVSRDDEGKPFTVRYEAVNAMLLNEFLKEHRTVQEQGATIRRQRKDFEAAIAQQQKLSALYLAGFPAVPL